MFAHVAELVYAYASEAYGAILGGSSPLMRTYTEMAPLSGAISFCVGARGLEPLTYPV